MAIIGLIYFIKQQKITALFIIIPIILGLLPFVAGSRFLIFSAPILAIGIGYFVQLLFSYEAQYKTIKHQSSRYISVAAVVFLGLYSSYSPNTFSMAKPAILQLEYLPLLRQLNAHTPADSYIWTSWDMGYPIHYYLDKNTFADGQFSDGEKLYYLHFPLAADNLALSANFMRFYSEQGVAGMKTLYQATGGEVEAFRLLKEVLSKKPKQAKKIIARKLPNLSATSADLTTVEQWLSFLYPKQNKAIYLLLHQRMLKTVTWFKQGNTDLATGKEVGLPFFLGFENLLEDSTGIQNDKIIIDRQKRTITDKSTKVSQSLSHLLTRDNNGSKITRFARLKRQQYFAFEWDKTSGYGAVMSNELSKTSLNKLFMRKKKSDYFQAISLKSPAYQIWKVQGDVIPLFKNK
ncbi:Oligosaccharyltransferase PglB [uncultured Candidatus Thioglobus sp.]|nr:Oligosaccharyltransferase PglB [uncultured Candidatus Thioglobus sp.]